MADANPTLDQLQVFLAVAEAGSFSAAARRLNRAQSAVSYAITNLEAQLQVQLFERAGTRQPRLTAAGNSLLVDARRLVADLRLLRARASGLGQGLEGEVALAIDMLLPMPVLTASLQAFRAAFPTVGVRLHTGTLDLVPDLVRRGVASLGVAGPVRVADGALVRRRIGCNRLLPVAAPEHPLARAEPPVPAAVVREHFQIVVTGGSPGDDYNVHAFDTWRVADTDTKRALLLAGLGWGGLPGWMVAADIADGRLVELGLESYPRTDYDLFALRAAGVSHGPAATWLVERFERELAAFDANAA